MCYLLGITAPLIREEDSPPELSPSLPLLLSSLDSLGLVHDRIMIFFFFLNGRKKRQNKTEGHLHSSECLLGIPFPTFQTRTRSLLLELLPSTAYGSLLALDCIRSGWRIPEEKNEW